MRKPLHMPCTRTRTRTRIRTCTRTWQVRLFRAALRLPKYAGLGLAPDTTPVDMALLAWSQRRPGDGAGRRLGLLGLALSRLLATLLAWDEGPGRSAPNQWGGSDATLKPGPCCRCAPLPRRPGALVPSVLRPGAVRWWRRRPLNDVLVRRLVQEYRDIAFGLGQVMVCYTVR